MVKNNLATLVINKTERKDSGKYNLTLENEFGREKCSIDVNVLDKPESPRNINVNEVSGTKIF